MIKIIKYISIDILRNKFVLAYAFILAVISMSVFNLEDNTEKGILSILNVVLILVPLISIIFSTVYVYNSVEFIELLISQPIRRKSAWLSLFAGIGISISMAFAVGVGIPVIAFSCNSTGFLLVISGIVLSWVFVSVALLGAVLVRDKARGVGLAILMWLWFAIVFDGLILFILFQFSDYPLEKNYVGVDGFESDRFM
jgi:Cu-processing system permease protein